MRRLLVAVVLLAGTAALADMNVLTRSDTEIAIWGKLHVEVDNYTVDSATDAGDASGTRLQTHSSRFAFKGSHAINEDMKGVFQIEAQANMTGDEGAEPFARTRNTYIGISSARAGEVRMGKHDVAYKMATIGDNIFADAMGENDNIVSEGAGRPDDVALYLSPKVGGFQFLASAALTDAQEYTGDKLAPTNKAADVQAGHNASAAICWEGPAKSFANVAYEMQKSDVLSVGDKASGYDSVVLSAGCNVLENTKLVGAVESRSGVSSGVADQLNYSVGVKQGIGAKHAVKVQYSIRDVDAANSDADLTTAGYSYAASKSLELYVMATMINNDSASAVDYSDGKIGNVGKGDDLQAVVFGSVYEF